jgi:hypothetical protein
MEAYVKESILNLIETAEKVRAQSLTEEERDEKGYPYVCGYTTSTLRAIRDIVECC